MKKIHLLTATAGILLALAGPTLAAQRTVRAYDAYGSASTSDRSGAYYYGPQGGYTAAQTPTQHQFMPSAGASLPYADRPYGDPDRW